MPRIIHVLDLSTAHLPEKMGADLTGTDGVTAYRMDEYGWLMWVPPAGPPDDETPTEITAIHRYARSHGCRYVLFDCDAETDPNLPTWEW